ncbi:hypothetical protein ABB37_01421 [Leptomonas pyrrhocoris]|uniref:Uncharacterized protein n=1 Tax=Leptomonas pyrrhocoris TaxID=157538 RepID=A0A0N0DZ79_LEPPY|nr:hypothetical protein ABB37_01421 [Leptomonas pyrrhocoris]XP_015663425.1 hypothetical protein ABB37_01421 [Leptomonas pyrrhocoris]XP_015663426.1 hypothetical protein ABB37_01421 [Leptomonas pyrrhocoris]KPA84985.1 hypothetical protein ABB37_01421 [Leptomonas pyrrhocoris]KPA84986.1 hypothetical protein ABB37_01421 [Leptomonas pyrrhocoris]KPA84987.1 hypothetical protein ABB37_01421 [Leptomonas pyrrhocoris]|eukprot:XP_015663424.1 hypothetical protein ABB37_01421 [Leptomonas pyrrhocoris]
MEPLGCSCVLVTQRDMREAKSSFNENTSTEKATKAPQQSSPSHTRHRVTLTGITPGTVLRTRASVAAWVRTAHQLPSPEQYTIVMRDGQRVPAAASFGHSVSLPVLPCRRASALTCAQCPWMALQERQQSKSAKQRAWRTSLTGAVRNCWSAALSSATEEPAKEGDDRKDGRTPHVSPHIYTQMMSCISFLAPLATPVPSNRLQALQLQFCRRLQQGGTGTAIAAATELSRRDIHLCTIHDRAVIHLLREGAITSNESGSAAMDGAADRRSDCLLETLEQKRLVSFLQRWAAKLPTSMQDRLHGVFISQPNTTTTLSAATASSSLHVVLVVERDLSVLGMQSPLCGSAHPADLLSAEEQQLVGVVTSAAPLLADVEVLVCILGESSLVHSPTGAPEACVHVLYPTLNRAGSIEQLQHGNCGGSSTVKEPDSCTKITQLRDASSALHVRCWCEPLEKELQARLSPYHAAFSAVPHTWLTLGDGKEAENPARAQPPPLRHSPNALPWVPTFWRHPAALDMCCSALMSLLLEEMEDRVCLSPTATKDSLRTPKVIEVQTPLSIEIRPVHSSLTAGASAEDIGAFAGQRILDAALQSLSCEATVFSSLTEPRRASENMQENHALRTVPQHVLVSVSDSSSDATGTADVEAALTASLTMPVRLCLYSCTANMKTEKLSARVASIVQMAVSCRTVVRVRAGIIDVDPLSSSYVAFAQVDLTLGTIQR